MYEKLGLKNSDIIKNINQSPVTDPAKALKLFEDLKSQRSIQVVVEREGIDVPLQYQIR
jgi:type II secretory pathway component PulC